SKRSVTGTDSLTRSAPKGLRQSLASIRVPVPKTRSGYLDVRHYGGRVSDRPHNKKYKGGRL
ncbi:MAG: hypothetical protein FWE22_07175, partial [Firmicutes bacterium]|nr:hypothetical protein [Bacillota bacterium]